jgi:quercetin dioxygenase-like cupin family protein
MQSWDLTQMDAPDGTRDPVVLETADGARAVMLVIGPGQELGDHEVRERAWVTVVEGRATIEAGGKNVECESGTLVTFDPGERHAVRSESGARILLLLAPWPGKGHYPADEQPPS